jgi:hypothetical protein
VPVGAEVRFKLVRGERGPQAADIQLVELSGNSLRRLGDRATSES